MKSRVEIRRVIAAVLADDTLFAPKTFYDEADRIIDALKDKGLIEIKE